MESMEHEKLLQSCEHDSCELAPVRIDSTSLRHCQRYARLTSRIQGTLSYLLVLNIIILVATTAVITTAKLPSVSMSVPYCKTVVATYASSKSNVL